MQTRFGGVADADWRTRTRSSSIPRDGGVFKPKTKSMHLVDRIRMNTLGNKDIALICDHVWKPS